VIPLVATAEIFAARQSTAVERHDGVEALRWIVFGRLTSVHRALSTVRVEPGQSLAIER
jgi:hypothetical protein